MYFLLVAKIYCRDKSIRLNTNETRKKNKKESSAVQNSKSRNKLCKYVGFSTTY